MSDRYILSLYFENLAQPDRFVEKLIHDIENK